MSSEELLNGVVVSPQREVLKLNQVQNVVKMSADVARSRISQAVLDFEKLKPDPPEWFSDVDNPSTPLSDKSGTVTMCGAFITLGIFGTATAFLPLVGSLSVLGLSTVLTSFASISYFYRGKYSSKKQPFVKILSKVFLSPKNRAIVDKRSLELKQYQQAKKMYNLMVEARRKEFEQVGVFEAMRTYDEITGGYRELVLYSNGSFVYEEVELEQVTEKKSVTNQELTLEIASYIEKSIDSIRNDS